jgi:flagellar basal-body rod protein FlgF
MDRMIHVAVNALKNMRMDRTVNANNLANANVPGFRRDMPMGRDSAFLQSLDQFSSRVFTQAADAALFEEDSGQLVNSGEKMDIAIRGEGYLFIQPSSGGEPALSRRGDLGLDNERRLVDGVGNLMLDTNLDPIQIPAFREFAIDDQGIIFIEPVDAPIGTRVQVASLATTLAEGATLSKSGDSHIRPIEGALPPVDQGARIAQGFLESSNVNTVTELIANIEGQRQFEMSVKFIKTAKELDERTSQLMRMPSG